MDPVGLLVARARGLELPALGLLLWTNLPNYICAGLAMLPSTIIIHLGRKVNRARQLGSYRLVERIGSGGMGEVWKAEHRLLARPAAIKLIRSRAFPEGPDRIAEERFRREAEAAAGRRSPHTIQLYDFGITRDRRLYYVMELLEGVDLETLVTRYGPQPPERVAHILRPACHSLGEAHAGGLVHRDVKPANVHLGRFGEPPSRRLGAPLPPGLEDLIMVASRRIQPPGRREPVSWARPSRGPARSRGLRTTLTAGGKRGSPPGASPWSPPRQRRPGGFRRWRFRAGARDLTRASYASFPGERRYGEVRVRRVAGAAPRRRPRAWPDPRP